MGANAVFVLGNAAWLICPFSHWPWLGSTLNQLFCGSLRCGIARESGTAMSCDARGEEPWLRIMLDIGEVSREPSTDIPFTDLLTEGFCCSRLAGGCASMGSVGSGPKTWLPRTECRFLRFCEVGVRVGLGIPFPALRPLRPSPLYLEKPISNIASMLSVGGDSSESLTMPLLELDSEGLEDCRGSMRAALLKSPWIRDGLMVLASIDGASPKVVKLSKGAQSPGWLVP